VDIACENDEVSAYLQKTFPRVNTTRSPALKIYDRGPTSEL